ncbi:MAG: Mov34/MPN/PAD-1 family protein [Gallionella sp.]|nr:Mov34/MPN/PAD-1 family protein [Gallionella sp.]MDD4959466.1 Mov34/MPN/PAD-1 family protein [Gallionella sp.]
MCLLADWACPNTGVISVLHPSVLQVLSEYIQNEKGKPESGGILLGLRRGAHFEVTSATAPTQFDKQSRFHFKRDSIGHSTIATEAWKRSGGYITYIGEWHTHPEHNPTPSSIDLQAWRELTRDSLSQDSYLRIIVGISKLWVGLSLPDGSLSELKPV